MKILNYWLLSIICLGLLGSKCATPENAKPQKSSPLGQAREGIDPNRVESNWTELAKAARASGQWDGQQKKWKNAAFEGNLPAYVSVFADCGSINLGGVANDPGLSQIRGIAVAQNDKIVLVGEPGFDTDARIQALAWQSAKECAQVPEFWRGRNIVSIDLSTIKDDVLAKKLPDIEYLLYVKRVFALIMEKYGSRAIYYLNEFPVLANTNVDPESILRIFLDANVTVIIEATPAEFTRHFSSPERLATVKHVHLQPLSSELVLPAVSALDTRVPGDVVEDIVRLTRGFLPEKGFLGNTAQAMRLIGDQPSRDTAIAAVASLDGRLQREALLRSSALDRKTTLAELDANVALSRRYYLDQQKKEDLVQGAKQAMEPAITGIKDELRKVESKLNEAEKRITESLAEKSRELQDNIDKISSKLDAATLELATKLVAHTETISKELTAIANKQDSDKAELIAKIAESQATLLSNFNAKLSKLSTEQQRMFEEVSTANTQIANAVSELQRGSTAQMTKISEIISQQLALERNLNEKTALLSAGLSQTNAELAAVVLRLDTLSAEQKKLFETVTDIQGTITNTLLPKIDQLSKEQKKAIIQIDSGLQTISRTIESTELKIMTKISDNYRDLLLIIENNKNALIADAAEKVALLNTTFANEIARLDEQGTKQKNEINARIDGAISSLTEALKLAKADLSKTIGDLSVTLATLTNKVAGLDEKASESEKALLAEIANATQKMSDALKGVSEANKKELLAAVTTLTREHREFVKELDDLGSEVLSQKADGLKELADNISETAAALALNNREDLTKLKNLRLAFKNMATTLGRVELHLMQLQKNLADKTRDLDEKLDKVGSRLDSVSLELAKEVKDNTRAISDKLSDIVKRQDLDKTEVLEKIANAQEHLLKDFTAKLGSLSLAQEEKFKEVSKAHEQIAAAIAKTDKASADRIAQIAEQQVAFEKSLNAANERFAGDVSKTNGELAALFGRFNTLSADQQKLFDTMNALQKEIADTVMPKIGELSTAQKDALEKITNGLATLSSKVDVGEQKVMNQIATNYQDLLVIIENNRNALIAAAAEKVALLNTTFVNEIARVDARIGDAVTSLTQAIKDSSSGNKTEFAKSIGELGATLEGVIKKVAALDEKTVNSEKAVLEKIASSVKDATDQLSQAITSRNKDALAEVNKSNLAIAGLTERLGRMETNVASLQSKLEDELKETRERIDSLESKIEKSLHAEIARANKELSDYLNKAMASGDQKVMDAVNLASATHKSLVEAVDNLSAQTLVHKLEILEKLERKIKESTDSLKVAIATQRDEDVAKVNGLQNDVGALSNRLVIVENAVSQLQKDLTNGLKAANAAIEAAKTNVGQIVTATQLSDIAELSKTIAGLQSQVDGLAQTVSEQKADLLAELTKRCAELAKTWEEAVNDKTAAAVKPLIDTIKALEQKTNELGSDLSGTKQDAGAKIQVLIDDHAALKSQVEELIKSRDSESLKTAEAIANTQKALAQRVDALENRGPEYDRIWEELRAANEKLRKELGVSIQAAKDGAAENHNAAIEEIRALAEKQTALAQSLANADKEIAETQKDLKDLKEEFINVYKFLFRQPGLLHASEKKRSRQVDILPNCLTSTLDDARKRIKNPNLLIVECGINCLVVDKKFGFKEGEEGDRSTGGFFEFELEAGLTSDLPKVRCTPIRAGTTRTSNPSDTP